MSNYPHGHADHLAWGCNNPECIKIIAEKEKTVDDFMAGSRVIEGEHSMAITNMEPSWVQQRDGSLISIERAKEMNRAQRRKLGIKL